MDDRSGPVVGVIDYKAGNSQSVVYALNHLGVPNRLMKTPADLDGVERIILPGVGSAGTTMDYLNGAQWPDTLRSLVVEGGTPFLGICVGLQVMFESSAEQDTKCLGWLPGTVRPFEPEHVRVPQMGWNEISRASRHPFVAELPAAGHFYFVNSYFVVPQDDADSAATTEYGVTFTSAVARDNIMGTQFHVEKSGPLGLDLLRRFSTLPAEELCSRQD
jgi:glutamine amidotransferase